ncbi:E3 ubiquitin-protein ligase Mdm2 [Merluccius polli]|uniref:E3 ubiquitin-protein ligase Mdm2 n=1 Tax=Merluccius polli TaxID=89951 RepID=A0AA47P469_MERPO|nr:E3 ubiquitin-protein ligase Mdm2 [Merluccius polli]
MYYLGQYIMQKQLYDQTHQHIVHCSHDALGQVLGVHSFSVKEPRVLFSLITKNLVAVRSNEASPDVSQQCDGQTEEASVPPESTRRRRRRSRRSSEPVEEQEEEEEEEEEGGRKRRRSDSFSLTFDDSLSWCVIGGLRNDTDCHGHSSDTHSMVSDNFSVEFEVESLDSDDYSDEETSLSGDDQVYEVTIFEAEEDSSDEDTEITQADYWRCSKCEEWNPPLPRNCNRCWELRQDWLPELSVSRTNSASSDPKVLPPKPSVDQSAAYQDTCPAPPPPSSPPPSSSKLPGPASPPLPPPSPCDRPDPERSVSMETRLPDACLEPCVICQTRPKNGCIVHGRTGHLMACYSCAKKLKRRNKLCPVCREPIQSVVLTYLS